MIETTFWNLLTRETYAIVIPVNQRQYAQGRLNREADGIRAGFVHALKNALTSKAPKSLDLLYGSLEKGNFIPFDGQQRLTTLFLLHWLLAWRSGNLNNETRCDLHKFRYDMREETEKFCSQIIDRFEAGAEGAVAGKPVSEIIRDAPWFDAKWTRDPCIAGMFTMLDALDSSLRNEAYDELWLTLTGNNTIAFFYEEIGNIGTTGEELYITMNSRGKELTPFEKFKPQLLGFIKDNYAASYAEFCENLDGKWLDFFWVNFGQLASEDKAGATDKAGQCPIEPVMEPLA